MSILLTVIVPVYNIKDYVGRCIESICSQSYRHLEIILVDDGSTDGSGHICDEFAQEDSRIKVIHKINGGAVNARKAGAQAATGDYVINVDGDDWIEKDRFKNLVEKALSQKPCMAYMSGYYKDYADRSVFVSDNRWQTIYEGEQIKNELMDMIVGKELFMERHMDFAPWLWCMRRDLYVKNQLKADENIKWLDDFMMAFVCVLDSKKIVCIEESGYHYIQREGSTVNRKTNWNEEQTLFFYNQMLDIVNANMSNAKVRSVAVQYIFNSMISTNYKKIYEYYSDYLFPFPDVDNGKKIIVYGAGNIGVEIVNAINEKPKHEIVAWVDKYRKENPRSVTKIEDISVVDELEYDYIVIAVLVADVSLAIKQELLEKGVPENKIAIMQSRVMNMNDLNNIMQL